MCRLFKAVLRTSSSQAAIGRGGRGPEAAGYRSSILESAEQMVYRLPTTSMMIVTGGKIVYSYGDTSHVSYLASRCTRFHPG
jgi:hypothetical protein